MTLDETGPAKTALNLYNYRVDVGVWDLGLRV